jgi:hypothetical protein
LICSEKTPEYFSVPENASPVQAAEEPRNLKNPNQRWRNLGRIAWDLAGSAFKLWVLYQFFVKESEIVFARIKSSSRSEIPAQKLPQSTYIRP